MAYAEIIENPGIPITARLIYALIACHASGRTGVARITIERIAEGLGLDESNVRRNIKVLEQALIIRRISKKRQPFVCQIRVPAHEQADAIKAPAPVERAPVPDIQNQNTKPKILTMEKQGKPARQFPMVVMVDGVMRDRRRAERGTKVWL